MNIAKRTFVCDHNKRTSIMTDIAIEVFISMFIARSTKLTLSIKVLTRLNCFTARNEIPRNKLKINITLIFLLST